MAGYTDTIRKYAADESHVGLLENADGTGEIGLDSGEAGRKLAVRFSLARRGERIDKIRYQVFGCGFTIAACAAAAELAEGETLGDAHHIDAGRIDSLLQGLPSDRAYCSDIAAKALQAAVSSAEQNGSVVSTAHQQEEHGPRICAEDTIYRRLIDSPAPPEIDEADRRLFAGLLAVAAGEPVFLHQAVGLDKEKIADILNLYFPEVSLDNLLYLSARAIKLPPQVNSDVLSIIRSHIPTGSDGNPEPVAAWLADILAARAAHPGHLWVAMGLFERPELSAAIRRHLPSLAAANNNNMRWKRFLFKQACDLNGGTMCKSPNCGDCSDYSLCFVE